MQSFFQRLPLDAPADFQLFNVAHIIALIISFLLIIGAYYWFNKIDKEHHKAIIRYSIIAFLFFSSMYKQWSLYQLGVPWYGHIPEATCGFAILTGTFALVTKNRHLFVLTFFWGWGAFTALFAPAILEGPDRYFFYQYFIRHALIVIVPIYLIQVDHYNIYKQDYWIYFVITLSLALFGLFISNIINDPEYLNMFYMLKPAVNNPFLVGIANYSHFLYVLFWIFVASLFGYVYGIPFYKTSPTPLKTKASQSTTS